MPDGARHKPLRMCAICRRRLTKAEMIRYVAGGDGMLVRDDSKTMPGRGWYCCGDIVCQKKFSVYRPRKKAASGIKRLASQGGI